MMMPVPGDGGRISPFLELEMGLPSDVLEGNFTDQNNPKQQHTAGPEGGGGSPEL